MRAYTIFALPCDVGAGIVGNAFRFQQARKDLRLVADAVRRRSCKRKAALKQRLLSALLSLAPSVGFACEPEAAMRLSAIRTLYADADIARYVCIKNGECSIEEFSRQVEVKAVMLNTEDTPAIQIEPKRKGKQYFSAIFLQDQCRYSMVFAPDTTFSSVKLLKTKKNNFYIARAVERESTDSWKEYDFSYDQASRQYSVSTTRCFKAHGATTVRVTCE